VLHSPSLPKLLPPPRTSLPPHHNLKSANTRSKRVLESMDEIERSAKRQKLASDDKLESGDDEAFFQEAEDKVDSEV
jgi:hypothetical protein